MGVVSDASRKWGDAMVLDMRPMLRGEIKRMDFDFSLPLSLPVGAEITGETHVTGRVADQAGYMHLQLTASVDYRAVCARCLTPVTGSFPVTLERTVAAKETLSAKQLEENVDEYAVIENGGLALVELVREELLLCFPTRFLCSPDCPGLCPKCGKPLRLGDCGCPKREPDPRLAVLGKLLEQSESTERHQ